MSTDSYIIITPVRNESQHLPKTIDSVVAQTVKPVRWIIVNDGSTDETAEIINSAARNHNWIKPVHRTDRGYREAGGGVVEAFYAGYDCAHQDPWDLMVKLDGDLSFDRSYFERCREHFRKDPKLGIGGGTVCAAWKPGLKEESSDPRFHVRGATKMYRRACWEAIGGLIRAPGWDSLDEIKANMAGWRTYTFADLTLQHHRHSGGEDGRWKDWVKNGRANYISGYHPLFMLLKCVKRAFDEGSVRAPAGLGWGFFSGYLKHVPRTEDEVIRYVRQEQVKKLLLQPSLWG